MVTDANVNPQTFFSGKMDKYLTPNIFAVIAKFQEDGDNFNQVIIPGDIRPVDKVGLWELGGMNEIGCGVAMLVGLPTGKMIERPISFNKRVKVNGRHALAEVWPGCIVTMGTSEKGLDIVLAFEVTNITGGAECGIVPRQDVENAAVYLNFVGVYRHNWKLTQDTVPDKFKPIVYKTVTKMKTKKARHAIYMDPWFYCGKNIPGYRGHFETPLPSTDDDIMVVPDFNTMMAKIEKLIRANANNDNTPVLQKIIKLDDDSYQMDMVVLQPDASTRNKINAEYPDDPGKYVDPILGRFRTIVTADQPVPENTTPYLKAKSFGDFARFCRKPEEYVLWLIFRG